MKPDFTSFRAKNTKFKLNLSSEMSRLTRFFLISTVAFAQIFLGLHQSKHFQSLNYQAFAGNYLEQRTENAEQEVKLLSATQHSQSSEEFCWFCFFATFFACALIFSSLQRLKSYLAKIFTLKKFNLISPLSFQKYYSQAPPPKLLF